jgi:hypothetical protein
MSSSPRWVLLALIAIAAATLRADSDPSGGGGAPPPADGREFHFVRLAYADVGFGRRQTWLTDWPEAETHLIGGLRRLSRIDVSEENRYLAIRDENLFEYPLLYAVEVGYWSLDDVEAARLRDAARRFLCRRFSRHRRMGELHAQHAQGVPGSNRRRHSR